MVLSCMGKRASSLLYSCSRQAPGCFSWMACFILLSGESRSDSACSENDKTQAQSGDCHVIVTMMMQMLMVTAWSQGWWCR